MPIDSDLKGKLWEIGVILILLGFGLFVVLFYLLPPQTPAPIREGVLSLFISLPLSGLVLILFSESLAKEGCALAVLFAAVLIIFNWAGSTLCFVGPGCYLERGGYYSFLVGPILLLIAGILFPIRRAEGENKKVCKFCGVIVVVIILIGGLLPLVSPTKEEALEEYHRGFRIPACCNELITMHRFCEKNKLPHPFKVDWDGDGEKEDCTRLNPGNDLQKWKAVCACPSATNRT